MLIKYTGGETITATTKNVLCDSVVAYWFTGAVPPKGYTYTIRGILDDSNNSTSSDFSYYIPIQNNSTNKFKTVSNIYDGSHYPTYVWAYIKMTAKFDNKSWSDISEPAYVEVRQKVNSVTITSSKSTTYPNSNRITYTISPSNSYNKGIKFSISSGSDVIALSGTTITPLKSGSSVIKITSADGKYTSNYTFTVNKAAATKTNPTAKTVNYNGSAQQIINAGSTSHGTFYYNTTNSDSGQVTSASNSKLKATNAGNYTRYWKFVPDSNHTGSVGWTKLTCTINKISQTAPTATGQTTTYPTTAKASASGGGGHGSLQWLNGNTQTSVGSKTTSARWSGDTNYNASPYSNTVRLTVNKAQAEFTYYPYSRNVIYNGSDQQIINPGSTSAGIIYYNVGTSESTKVTSASHNSLKARNVGHYVRYWKFVADSNHTGDIGWTAINSYIIKASQAAPTATGSTVYYPDIAFASASGGGGHGLLKWTNGNSLSGIGTKTTKAWWSGDSNYNPSAYSNTVTLKVLGYYSYY